MTVVPGLRSCRSSIRATRAVVALAFRADPWRASLSFLLSVAEAIGAAGLAFGLKLFTDAVVSGDERQMTGAAAILVGLGGAAATGNWVGFMVRTRLRERTELAVDIRLLDLTMRTAGLEQLERPEYADEVLLVRAQRGSLAGMSEAAALNVGFVVQAVTLLGLLASIHPALLALPLFGVPSVLLATRAEAAVQRGHEETVEGWRLRGELFNLATQAAPGKEVRLFALGRELLRRHGEGCRAINERMVRMELRAGLLSLAGAAVFSAGFAAAMAFVAWLAIEARASIGEVVLAVALAADVNREVSGAVASAGWLARAVRIARRYTWLVDQVDAAEEAARVPDPAPVPDQLRSGIDLVGVSFRYPGSDVDVLSGVGLHLPAGCSVAIVGDNGAGKTTLVKLLARLYEPTAGSIVVDGVDLRHLPLEDWRERLSAGFQDFVRYEVQAREAVGLGLLADAHDDDAVRAALDRAGATDLVASLPGGLTTQLGSSFEGGTDLSGGQWQKLALGRAMMRQRPLLLLLDEPTAALDAQTEHALFERYTRAARETGRASGAITVLVSHRFSTVRAADLIVVLDGGTVTDFGTHDDLVSRSGLYAELYELQARAYR